MTSTELGASSGQVVDHSADFEVEDFIPGAEDFIPVPQGAPLLPESLDPEVDGAPPKWTRSPGSAAGASRAASVAGSAAGSAISDLDEHRLAQRQKQVDYGKNTLGYQRYLQEVPKDQRKQKWKHPPTPDIYQRISKRCFDGQIKAWRRALHKYDDGGAEGPGGEEQAAEAPAGGEAAAHVAAAAGPSHGAAQQGEEPVAEAAGEGGGRKRAFNSAFDGRARRHDQPAKLLTSPGRPRHHHPAAHPASPPGAAAPDPRVGAPPQGARGEQAAAPLPATPVHGAGHGAGGGADAHLPLLPASAPPALACGRARQAAAADVLYTEQQHRRRGAGAEKAAGGERAGGFVGLVGEEGEEELRPRQLLW